jgi:dTDP-4-amino-4,6-dideoxygalactose transaminase
LIHYPAPVHLQPAYSDLGYPPGSLPNTEQASREVLSLPLYPELTEDEVLTVCKAVKDFLVSADANL